MVLIHFAPLSPFVCSLLSDSLSLSPTVVVYTSYTFFACGLPIRSSSIPYYIYSKRAAPQQGGSLYLRFLSCDLILFQQS